MSYRAIITFIQGNQTEDVFVPLSEDFTEAEYLADQIFGKAKSFEEASEFCQDRLDCKKRNFYPANIRDEWIKTWADQHWTLTWTEDCNSAFLTISGRDAGGVETFMRKRKFWLRDA